MPASVYVTYDQLVAATDLEADVVFHELPPSGDGELEVWVMDTDLHGNQHRSVILEGDGTVLSDVVIDDNQAV